MWYNKCMKSTNNFQTSSPEMVTISRAEYEEKNARLASQDERIARLESQVELLTEALRLARHKRFGASSEKTDESVMEQSNGRSLDSFEHFQQLFSVLVDPNVLFHVLIGQTVVRLGGGLHTPGDNNLLHAGEVAANIL